VIRTPQEARSWLQRHGVSVTEWSRVNGLDPRVVFALLSGRTRGLRGEAYRAAVTLGLRPGPGIGDENPRIPRETGQLAHRPPTRREATPMT